MCLKILTIASIMMAGALQSTYDITLLLMLPCVVRTVFNFYELSSTLILKYTSFKLNFRNTG